MVEYHITRFRHDAADPSRITWPASAIPVLGKHVLIRKRRDAACFALDRAVYEMVRDHASLDTEHGQRAQLDARVLSAADMPTPRGKAIRITHGGETIMLEAVA